MTLLLLICILTKPQKSTLSTPFIETKIDIFCQPSGEAFKEFASLLRAFFFEQLFLKRLLMSDGFRKLLFNFGNDIAHWISFNPLPDAVR
ncbi:MAG: hypothetical protein DI605_20800 [Sphingomonas sp.]|nr:MAG: hypothetical protein DI605_20800 [Sphingomonas sp.]